jgi:choline dehydrogenase-like flavoprotein
MMLTKRLLGGVWCLVFTINTLPTHILANAKGARLTVTSKSHTRKCCSKKHSSEDYDVYDFVIVGAGNTGCVLANRLSENGKYSVCVLEAGRDDARLEPPLPEASDAQVPQPGEYQWGYDTRAPDFNGFVQQNRGFMDFQHNIKASEDAQARRTTYSRSATWGGCTAHNGGISERNAPYSWDQWLALGLDEYDARDVNGPLVTAYRKAENRTQGRLTPAPFLYYDPAIAEPNPGAFPSASRGEPPYYGSNGMVPIRYVHGQIDPTNPDTALFCSLMYNQLNIAQGFNYPNDGTTCVLRDMDWPLTAHEGGVYAENFSYVTTRDLPQVNIITLPPGRPGAGTTVDTRVYCLQNYGDNGATFGPDAAIPGLGAGVTSFIGSVSGTTLTVESIIAQSDPIAINNSLISMPGGVKLTGGPIITGFLTGTGGVGTYTISVPQSVPSGSALVIGMLTNNRVSSANTYLYPALNRPNLTVKSEVLATKLIMSSKKSSQPKVRGVEYLEGWNIYQTGRNPNALAAGFGGSVGDAKFNGIAAREKGVKKVYARKEVILCAGTFNSPQLLMLSGIGDKKELKELGIKNKVHLPGVGKNLFDDQELFIFFQAEQPVFVELFLAAFVLPDDPFPKFDVTAYNGNQGVTCLETHDFTMAGPDANVGFVGVRNTPGVLGQYNRTTYKNILQNPDPTLNINPVSGIPDFLPYQTDLWNGMNIVQNTITKTRGYVKLRSTDPTVPPSIIYDYLSDPEDMEDMKNIMMKTVFPILLGMYNQPLGTRAFSALLFPSTFDILVPGVTEFVYGASLEDNLKLIDQKKLENWIKASCDGHHAMGTCKMGLQSGPHADPLAVVDQGGQVYGVKGLRICDNSIVPANIRWPNSNLYAIAEKISADVVAKYN